MNQNIIHTNCDTIPEILKHQNLNDLLAESIENDRNDTETKNPKQPRSVKPPKPKSQYSELKFTNLRSQNNLKMKPG